MVQGVQNKRCITSKNQCNEMSHVPDAQCLLGQIRPGTLLIEQEHTTNRIVSLSLDCARFLTNILSGCSWQRLYSKTDRLAHNIEYMH